MRANPVDPSLYPDDEPTARNDSGFPSHVVIATLKARGIEIRYGELVLLAQPEALEEARAEVAALPTERKDIVMSSIDRALRASLRKVSKGTASKKRMDAFYADLLLWTAFMEQNAS